MGIEDVLNCQPVATRDTNKLFINSRKARGLSPHTIRWYSGILGSLARMHPVLPNRPEPLEEFIASCGGGDERRHGYYRAIRAYYRFLERRLKLPNPVEWLEPPRRKRKQKKALMPDELNRLLAYHHEPKIKAALLFLADTGARIGELYNLELQDLTETPYGYTATVNGKTGPRIVPIMYETYHALQVNLPFDKCYFWLRRAVSKAFDNAQVEGTAHTLRHTFGTLWQGDEVALQTIMGHASFNTTLIYRHMRVKMICEQHAKYSPLKQIMASSRQMDIMGVENG